MSGSSTVPKQGWTSFLLCSLLNYFMVLQVSRPGYLLCLTNKVWLCSFYSFLCRQSNDIMVLQVSHPDLFTLIYHLFHLRPVEVLFVLSSGFPLHSLQLGGNDIQGCLPVSPVRQSWFRWLLIEPFVLWSILLSILLSVQPKQRLDMWSFFSLHDVLVLQMQPKILVFFW